MEDLDDANTGNDTLLFADDLPGTAFRLREASVYDAEEVRDELGGDVPRFGRWLPVVTDAEDAAWMVGLGELIEELQAVEDATAGTYRVTRCEQSGSGEQDPYEVNVEPVEDSAQTGLDV